MPSSIGGAGGIGSPGKPDLGFVDPLTRRRLSSHSGMALRVAEDCLSGSTAPDHYIFCSRYGEYTRSFDLLQALAKDEPPTPMAFSMSVHNTASSLYAMVRHDRSASVSIAAGSATLEAAFIEAWAMLHTGEAGSVLLVYAGEPLPDLYQDQESSVQRAAAYGLLLAATDATPSTLRLRLAWESDPATPAADRSDPALEVLRLISRRAGSHVVRDGRIRWSWNVSAP